MRKLISEDINKDDIEFLLLEKKYPKKLVAKMMGCSVRVITECSSNYGIRMLQPSEILKEQFNRGRSVNCKIYDIPSKDDINYLYNERGFSLNSVSKIFSTTIPTLKKWMKKYGFDNLRDNSSSQRRMINEGHKITLESPSKEDLEYMYDGRGYSISMLSIFFNVSTSKIRTWLLEKNIIIKSFSEAVKQSYNKNYRKDNKQLSDELYECLNNKQWMDDAYNAYTTEQLGKILNVYWSTISRYLKLHNIKRDNWLNRSSGENEVYEYVKQLITNNEVLINDRSLGFELDIYIPEKKLAIEFNGIFWHSQDKKGKNYHKNKTDGCNGKGIQLLHIFENEWADENKKEIWKSVIRNKLGIYEKKIGARKTKLGYVSKNESDIFLEENHLQGSCNSSYQLGLYDDGLICLMTFGKSRYNKGAEWELLRFVSKKGYKVIGGASKLLKYFRNKYSGKIISYANKRWSNGDLYEKIGFDYIHDSSPNYFYYKNGSLILESRIKYQKHKLKNILDVYDEKLSESKNMENNGYNSIYDSGNKVYIL